MSLCCEYPIYPPHSPIEREETVGAAADEHPEIPRRIPFDNKTIYCLEIKFKPRRRLGSPGYHVHILYIEKEDYVGSIVSTRAVLDCLAVAHNYRDSEVYADLGYLLTSIPRYIERSSIFSHLYSTLATACE